LKAQKCCANCGRKLSLYRQIFNDWGPWGYPTCDTKCSRQLTALRRKHFG
jgi:hypothetical protein